MKLLIIGGGGRENALAWAAASSLRVSELVCAPGNGGIALWGAKSRIPCRCAPVDATSLEALVALAEAEQPDLVVVGPEVPLAMGLVDELERSGTRVFGPTRAAARLETSKSFAKEFMRRHSIDTAAYALCRSHAEVLETLDRFALPVVVKADGLAAGKGVVICATRLEAEQAAFEMLDGGSLEAPARQVVLEEFLEGEELSFFALCDGKHARAIAAAQDHKRIGEGDTGPNTGGMGAYSTSNLVSASMCDWLTENIAQKVVDGMASEGTPFKGILFCGIMMALQADGTKQPMVLEFNTRFGDPETQALMMRMDLESMDIVDLFEAAIDGTAGSLRIAMRPGASVCVIAASEGYPGSYPSGRPISGLNFPADSNSVTIFHSGTAFPHGSSESGEEIVTAGGRVLGVTAYADDLKSALALAYARLDEISFEGMQYRRDIGWRALRLHRGEAT